MGQIAPKCANSSAAEVIHVPAQCQEHGRCDASRRVSDQSGSGVPPLLGRGLDAGQRRDAAATLLLASGSISRLPARFARVDDTFPCGGHAGRPVRSVKCRGNYVAGHQRVNKQLEKSNFRLRASRAITITITITKAATPKLLNSPSGNALGYSLSSKRNLRHQFGAPQF